MPGASLDAQTRTLADTSEGLSPGHVAIGAPVAAAPADDAGETRVRRSGDRVYLRPAGAAARTFRFSRSFFLRLRSFFQR